MPKPAPDLDWPELPCRVNAGERLRVGRDLDPVIGNLLVPYLQRIAYLEQQVRLLQAQLSSHAPQLPREGPAPWREPHA